MSDQKAYDKLKKIRTRTDLKLRSTPLLNKTFIDDDGVEHDFVLRYYQVQGIMHLIIMPRFLLGDDTGLGKTPMSIAALCFIWEKTPDTKVIVLTTKTASGQWIDEFSKFTNGVQTWLCRGAPAKRKKILKAWEEATGPSVIVMGYATARQDVSALLDLDPGYVLITDEATAYKTPSTQTHQVVDHLARRASRVWGLTATLIENNLLEGWAIFKVVVPGLLGSKSFFMDEYCIVQRMQIGRRWIPKIIGYRPTAPEAFKEKIAPYFLGRPKWEVATELPALTRKRLYMGMSNSQDSLYENALEGLLEVVNDEGEVVEVETTKLTSLIYCQEIVNHPGLIGGEGSSDKLDMLVDLLTNGDLADQKVIVYTRFRKMVDIIVETLQKKKVGVTRITGTENEETRNQNKKAFQKVGSDTRVICINAAAKQGVNLQSAKALIFFDTPWSAGDYLQILGRMIRIGSKHDSVVAYHLLARDTIDERVMDVLKSKMVLVERVLGKRLKGDQDVIEVAPENEISMLYSMLQDDARKRRNQ